ncbi:MAG: abortive infection family protein [Bacillota bacterium]|nr:abortive infection family protein [Bacillota bacterium]
MQISIGNLHWRVEHMARAPLSDTIITAVARLVDDSQEEGWREPSHSDLDFCFERAGLKRADPRAMGQPAGKSKRVRAVFSWALDNDPAAGERLVDSLLAVIRGYGGFREGSPNYVGRDSILNAVQAFRIEGFDLSTDGELRPLILDNLSDKDLTMALRAYVRRARRGALDAALLAGTGKDLLEAVAKHVLDILWGQHPNTNFPTLLGQAFVALGMATSADKAAQGEAPQRQYERTLYDLGCAVNTLRNREGTGHGRPFLPTLSQAEAASAVQAMGLVCDYMLQKLEAQSLKADA